MVRQLLTKLGTAGAKSGAKGAKSGGFISRLLGRKGATSIGLVTDVAKITDEVGVGAKNLDELKSIHDDLINVSADGTKVRPKKGYKIVDKFGKEITHAGGKMVPWDESYRIVKSYRKSSIMVTQATADVAKRAKGLSIPLPGFRTTLKLGFIVAVGYPLVRWIMFVSEVTGVATERIYDFFGVNCEGDAACEQQGAKNMAMIGIIGVVGVGGILYLAFRPRTQRLQVVSNQGAVA